MADFKKYFFYLITMLMNAISYVPAAIYEYVYSEFFTK